MMELYTTNLKLRPCSAADREDFIDLERDPEVMRFLNGGAGPPRAVRRHSRQEHDCVCGLTLMPRLEREIEITV